MLDAGAVEDSQCRHDFGLEMSITRCFSTALEPMLLVGTSHSRKEDGIDVAFNGAILKSWG